MGILLALCMYIIYAALMGRIAWRILTIWEGFKHSDGVPSSTNDSASALKASADIFLLSRLFRMSPLLWIGEWLFHLSFVLVILRHLRYVLEPVPGWVKALQPLGIWAGYVLPFSLAYILIVKTAVEKKKYTSSSNIFLLGILFLISVTGLLMKTLLHPDIAGIKHFTIGIFSFSPGILPASPPFVLHFVTALLFLTYLPAHIFAAPLSILDAQKRKDGLHFLMHRR